MRQKKTSASAKRDQNKPAVERPDVFRYHDYRAFLRDWLAYRKASQPGFTLRGLSESAGLATGYLPMMLNGNRELTAKALGKLLPFLGLAKPEQGFLESLLKLASSSIHEASLNAFESMARFEQYKRSNPKEAEAFQYLKHWYYVAIRELASVEGFRVDPSWVHSQLRGRVTLGEVREALDFLLQNGFIRADASGVVSPPDKVVDCRGPSYQVALAQFHREAFGLATEAIASVDRDERFISGHTIALSREGYGKARAVVEDALKKLWKLGEDEKKGEAVYHLEVALFPMTKRRDPK